MRVLACLDPIPAQDGSCAQTAYIDLPSWVDYLPTVDQANEVGIAMFVSLMTLAVARRLLLDSAKEHIQ